jgi:hypothetical protein
VNNGDEYNKLGQDIDKYIENYKIRIESNNNFDEEKKEVKNNYDNY